MNQKEDFLQTLLTLTREKKITWKMSGLTRNISKYIINSDQVSQVFYSEFNDNEIYFIVQKYIKYDYEFDLHIEDFTYFINIIFDYNLVYSICEDEVSENMLNDLLMEIRSNFENSFYNSFMEEIKPTTPP
ncbi:MAG: hypothetical protein LBH43_02985 [Treponema sp.]|jgi:hypothetical protein|nr:hypothetical protein [Treponema sp.]